MTWQKKLRYHGAIDFEPPIPRSVLFLGGYRSRGDTTDADGAIGGIPELKKTTSADPVDGCEMLRNPNHQLIEMCF